MEREENEIRGHEYVLTASEINKQSLLLAAVVLLLTVIPFSFIWGWGAVRFNIGSALWWLLILVTGIIVHELIHGCVWAYYARTGFRSISFGILWSGLIPYCHCNEPLPVRQYIIGAAMPTILLGILPVLFALYTGNAPILAFAVILLIGGSGDAMIIRKMRTLNKDMLIMDHPSKPGFYIPDETGTVIHEKEIITKEGKRFSWRQFAITALIGLAVGIIGYIVAKLYLK